MIKNIDLAKEVGLTEENSLDKDIQMIMDHPEIHGILVHMIAVKKKQLLDWAKNYSVEAFTQWYEQASVVEKVKGIKEVPSEILMQHYVQTHAV